MRSTNMIGALLLSGALLAVQPATVHADEELEVELEERDAAGVTKGPRCTFTRAEKFGMLLWLFPIAGAVYTPFACKKDVFSKKVSVETDST